MECCNAVQQIGLELDGELPERDVAALHEHLGACAACFVEWQCISNLVRLLHSTPPATPVVSPELWERIQSRLEAQKKRMSTLDDQTELTSVVEALAGNESTSAR